MARSLKVRRSLRAKARRQVKKLIALYGRTCFYCSCDIHEDLEPGTQYALTVEHLKPISKGGKSNIENLRLACYPCNQKAERSTGTPGPTTFDAVEGEVRLFLHADAGFAPLPRIKPKTKPKAFEETLDLEDGQGRRELLAARDRRPT